MASKNFYSVVYLTAAPFHLNTKQQSIKEILPDLPHNLDPLVLKIVTLQGINKRNRRERGTDRPKFHYDPMMVDSFPPPPPNSLSAAFACVLDLSVCCTQQKTIWITNPNPCPNPNPIHIGRQPNKRASRISQFLLIAI